MDAVVGVPAAELRDEDFNPVSGVDGGFEESGCGEPSTDPFMWGVASEEGADSDGLEATTYLSYAACTVASVQSPEGHTSNDFCSSATALRRSLPYQSSIWPS